MENNATTILLFVNGTTDKAGEIDIFSPNSFCVTLTKWFCARGAVSHGRLTYYVLDVSFRHGAKIERDVNVLGCKSDGDAIVLAVGKYNEIMLTRKEDSDGVSQC